MVEHMIDIRNIIKIFDDTRILDDFSAQVTKGEVVSILGPSGSGKSTLLRCLNLLSPPDAGSILIDGEMITQKAYDRQKLRQRVGMVFQHFYLFPHLSVIENLTYGPLWGKKEEKALVIERAESLLERVGLIDKRHAIPGSLSGGQKQRVAIARCLAMEPEVILFDEPTSALDPEMVKEVLEVIKSLVHTHITILIVTHEMAFAREVADTIWFMDKGRLIEKDIPSNFFAGPTHPRAKVFLEKVL